MRIVESAADAKHPASTDEVARGASVTSNVPHPRAMPMRIPPAKRSEDMQSFATSPSLSMVSPRTHLPETFSLSPFSDGRDSFAAQAAPETLI